MAKQGSLSFSVLGLCSDVATTLCFRVIVSPLIVMEYKYAGLWSQTFNGPRLSHWHRQTRVYFGRPSFRSSFAANTQLGHWCPYLRCASILNEKISRHLPCHQKSYSTDLYTCNPQIGTIPVLSPADSFCITFNAASHVNSQLFRSAKLKMMSINARNVNSTTGIPKSLTEVIAFLTRPLIMFYTPSEIAALEIALQTTLTAAYFASRQPQLFLMLSPASQPPRPILVACIAASVRWADWMIVLGGKELDILVEPSRVAIRYGGQDGTIKTIWQESNVYRPKLRIQVPPSTHEGPAQASLRATIDSAVSRAQGLTKAQELLVSNDKEEADEIFSLLSNVTGITPTPTHEQFQLDNLSSESSPDSSRPSSRSSNFSFFSLASSTDSMTSVSSTSSPSIEKASIKPVVPPRSRSMRSDDVPELEDADESDVQVDRSKKSVQKYMYRGGVSTVLTGGVMLGSAKKATRDERPASGNPHTSFGRQRGAATNGNWRRL